MCLIERSHRRMHLFVMRPRSDSEFTAQRIREWLRRVGAKTLYVGPRAPCDKGRLESLRAMLRDGLLAREMFDTLLEANVLIERWQEASNTVRSHSSLGHPRPAPVSLLLFPLVSATPQQADRGDPFAGRPGD